MLIAKQLTTQIEDKLWRSKRVRSSYSISATSHVTRVKKVWNDGIVIMRNGTVASFITWNLLYVHGMVIYLTPM